MSRQHVYQFLLNSMGEFRLWALSLNICDTTEEKISYMYYKIKIQCLAFLYHFFSPDYSSFVDKHSVLHIITVILSFTFIAANTEHLQRPGDEESPPGLQL